MKLILVALISFVLASGASAQQTEHLQKDAGGKPLRYLLYQPEVAEDSQARLPLVLFLHGGGEGGNDIEKVKKHGLPKLIEQGSSFRSSWFRRRIPVRLSSGMISS